MEIRRSRMGAFLTSYAHAFCTVTWRDLVLHVRKKQKAKKSSHRELCPFQNFAIPLRNLQFHCKCVSLWEGFSEHCGLSPLRCPSAWLFNVCTRWKSTPTWLPSLRGTVTKATLLVVLSAMPQSKSPYPTTGINFFDSFFILLISQENTLFFFHGDACLE